MERIDTKRGRDGLLPRREPYWYKLSRGSFLGLRKSANEGGSWIARYRDDQHEQHYKALGELSEELSFDAAKIRAEEWFKDVERGVRDYDATGERATVGTACKAYVRALRIEGREKTAHDAHMRFRRTVYGDTADAEFTPSGRLTEPRTLPKEPGEPDEAPRGWPTKVHRKRVRPHAVSAVPLAKIRAGLLREWHVGMTADGLSKSSANRTLSTLKAALNMAVRNRTVSAAVAQEWAEVQLLKHPVRRRDLFLDLEQRRALLRHAEGGFRDLLEAAIYTGCRAGELTSARRSAFDARTRSLTVTGKTGTRTFPLAPGAVELFSRVARDKLPTAYLLARNDGMRWEHSDWDELVKEAAKLAGLPKETCLYTLRHSFITQALLDGMSTLEVSKMVGTSLAMIEKHYGHLVYSTAHERLARVQIV